MQTMTATPALELVYESHDDFVITHQGPDGTWIIEVDAPTRAELDEWWELLGERAGSV